MTPGRPDNVAPDTVTPATRVRALVRSLATFEKRRRHWHIGCRMGWCEQRRPQGRDLHPQHRPLKCRLTEPGDAAQASRDPGRRAEAPQRSCSCLCPKLPSPSPLAGYCRWPLVLLVFFPTGSTDDPVSYKTLRHALPEPHDASIRSIRVTVGEILLGCGAVEGGRAGPQRPRVPLGGPLRSPEPTQPHPCRMAGPLCIRRLAMAIHPSSPSSLRPQGWTRSRRLV